MPDYNYNKKYEQDIVNILNGKSSLYNKPSHVVAIVNVIQNYFPKNTKYSLINSTHSTPGDILGTSNSNVYHIELKLGEFTTEAQTSASILGINYGTWNDVNPKYLSAVRRVGFKTIDEMRYKLRNPDEISKSDPRFNWILRGGEKTALVHQRIVEVTNTLKIEFLDAVAPYIDIAKLTHYFNRARKGYTRYSDSLLNKTIENIDYYIITPSGVFFRKPIYRPTYELMNSEIHFFCSRNKNHYVRLRPHWKNRGQGALNPCFMVWMEPPERLA